jgi:hypothetical protein
LLTNNSTTPGSGWYEDSMVNPTFMNNAFLGTSPGYNLPYGHRFTTQDSWWDTGGQSTAETITSWTYTSTSPASITFNVSGTNTLGTSNCVVIAGLTIGAPFNSQPGGCSRISSATTSSFTVATNTLPVIILASSFPSSATESGTATQYHAAMRFGFEGGPQFTGSSVCTEVGFYNPSVPSPPSPSPPNYPPAWQTCQGATVGSSTITTNGSEIHNGKQTFNGSAQFSAGIQGAFIGNVYNLATWSNQIGYSTGAGCTTHCWTISGGPTVTLNSTDFVDPMGGNSMTKVAFSSTGNLQDVNGLSLSSGTSYAVSFSACYGTNTATGVFTGTVIGATVGTGANAGFNMVQCSNTTPVYTHYCSYATPTSSLTNTVQINWGTTPAGGTGTIYLYGVSVAPSPSGGACPTAWTTTANPLTNDVPGVQAQLFLGSLIDGTQAAGLAQFSATGALIGYPVTISGTPSINQVLTATSATAANWQTPTGGALSASLTTTSATTDNVTITGMTSSGHCSIGAQNASAATNLGTSYISAYATNQITLTHTGTSGLVYDFVCTGN